MDGALEEFWRSLRPAGPDLLKGWIAVSFFMRRVEYETQEGESSGINTLERVERHLYQETNATGTSSSSHEAGRGRQQREEEATYSL